MKPDTRSLNHKEWQESEGDSVQVDLQGGKVNSKQATFCSAKRSRLQGYEDRHLLVRNAQRRSKNPSNPPHLLDVSTRASDMEHFICRLSGYRHPLREFLCGRGDARGLQNMLRGHPFTDTTTCSSGIPSFWSTASISKEQQHLEALDDH